MNAEIKRLRQKLLKQEIVLLLELSKKVNAHLRKMAMQEPEIDPEINEITRMLSENDFGGYRSGVTAIISAVVEKYTGKIIPGYTKETSKREVTLDEISKSYLEQLAVIIPETSTNGSCYAIGSPALVMGSSGNLHSSMLMLSGETGNTAYGRFRFASDKEIDFFYSSYAANPKAPSIIARLSE